MSSSKKKKPKSGNKTSRATKYFHEAVNRAIKDAWFEAGSHTEKAVLHIQSGFSKRYLTMSSIKPEGVSHRTSPIARKYLRTKSLIKEILRDRKATDKAIELIETRPTKWAYTIMAIQTDSDKVWYDSISEYESTPISFGSTEMHQKLALHCRDLVKNVNDKYLSSVSIFMFTDTDIDLEAMEPDLFEYLENKGVLDKELMLTKAQYNINQVLNADEDKELFKINLVWDNVGKLLREFYVNVQPSIYLS